MPNLAVSQRLTDVWRAIKALPPKYFVFLQKYRDQSTNLHWFKRMVPKMDRVPTDAQAAKDWDLSCREVDRFLRSN